MSHGLFRIIEYVIFGHTNGCTNLLIYTDTGGTGNYRRLHDLNKVDIIIMPRRYMDNDFCCVNTIKYSTITRQ